jgi:hypothetical protein
LNFSSVWAAEMRVSQIRPKKRGVALLRHALLMISGPCMSGKPLIGLWGGYCQHRWGYVIAAAVIIALGFCALSIV